MINKKRGKYESYTQEEREKALEIYKSVLSCRETAKRTGIPHGTIARWTRPQRPRKNKKIPAEALCWKCGNACGGCNWSRDFTPVEGWTAVETMHKVSGKGLRVIKCPEFVKG